MAPLGTQAPDANESLRRTAAIPAQPIGPVGRSWAFRPSEVPSDISRYQGEISGSPFAAILRLGGERRRPAIKASFIDAEKT